MQKSISSNSHIQSNTISNKSGYKNDINSTTYNKNISKYRLSGLEESDSMLSIQCSDHKIKQRTGKGNDKGLPSKLDNIERVNGNQETHIVENKEEGINSNYSHQTNIPSTHSLTNKNLAVQFNTSHHVSTINNSKHHCSQRNNNSTRTYNNAGSNKPVRNFDNN